jgi:predicted SnoaL-like aldol condensation-catalyzing enzyme
MKFTTTTLLCLQVIALTAVAERGDGTKGGKGGGKGSVKSKKGSKKGEKCEDLLEDCPYGNVVNGKCLTAKMIADQAFNALFVDFNVDAARALIAEDMIEHNPYSPTGSAALIAILPDLQAAGVSAEVHRTLEERNLVAYHTTFSNVEILGFGNSPVISFDVYRVEHGQVQEHWDNVQLLAGPNPNGNSMVDGPTMIKYRDQTYRNKATVLSFMENVLIAGNLTAFTDYGSEDFIQHSPDIADGLSALEEAFAGLAANGTAVIYHSVELVVAEGNFVLVGSYVELGVGNPFAFYNLFRVQDGLIVENWDVVEAIPPCEEFVHDNGKF